MAGKDTIIMSMKELRRAHVLHQVLEGKLRQVQAAEVMGLSDRQIRRIVKRVRREGDRGLVHRSRGRRSNRAIDGKLRARAIRLYRRCYADFGPTLAAEKLGERDGIGINDETLRLWLKAEGVAYPMRKKRPHRRWRERKLHYGEMIQMDGSHHDWLEGRGPAGVLMGYIDDATGRVFARFYAYEGTYPAMDSFKRYLKRYGVPTSVYLDRHTTYKSPSKAMLAEELEGRRPMSQFERALSELGVKVIHAYSPQAKGRIERLFLTFQDRMIKEMRLAEIQTMEEANRFLARYLPVYNKRFALPAVSTADLHRPAPSHQDLAGILCLKTERALRNDWTVIHHRRRYQVEDRTRATRVVVEERFNGTMYIRYQGQRLRYQEIALRPMQVPETPKSHKTIPRTKPAPHHPWRKPLLSSRRKSEIAVGTYEPDISIWVGLGHF